MDRREHHRAQLSLPVRLRWTTPFGQKTEISETLDISRSGLLVPCSEAHDAGVPLWVTFPYDTSLDDGQPEILAKVVRAAKARNGGSRTDAKNARRVTTKRMNRVSGSAVGLHFEMAAHPETNGNRRTREMERRSSLRRPVALPIRVRPEHIPWFEEAMTVDVSARGLRFLSSRQYAVGERLLVSFESSVAAPWAGTGEFLSRVVRAERGSQAPTLSISLSRVL